MPVSDRGTLMSRLADKVEEKKELFATIDAWDNGAPLSPKLSWQSSLFPLLTSLCLV